MLFGGLKGSCGTDRYEELELLVTNEYGCNTPQSNYICSMLDVEKLNMMSMPLDTFWETVKNLLENRATHNVDAATVAAQSKTMHVGEVIRLFGNSGLGFKLIVDFHNPINQSWVFARKCGGSYTTMMEVFTYAAWRPGAIRAEEVPLFEIGIGGAVPEPYVLFTTTDGETRVKNPEQPDFFCIVPACAMPGPACASQAAYLTPALAPQ